MPPKRKSTRLSAAPVSNAVKAESVDYSTFTVAQLKSECTKLGLDITGKKAELVQRLQENSGKIDIWILKTKIRQFYFANKEMNHQLN